MRNQLTLILLVSILLGCSKSNTDKVSPWGLEGSWKFLEGYDPREPPIVTFYFSGKFSSKNFGSDPFTRFRILSGAEIELYNHQTNLGNTKYDCKISGDTLILSQYASSSGHVIKFIRIKKYAIR